MRYSATPAPQGLYDPAAEHDACGVAAVVDIAGRRSHRIVADGVTALINLDHRGAAGADPAVGDGAGILMQIPTAFFRAEVDFDLPIAPEDADGEAFAVGTAFVPVEDDDRAAALAIVERIVAEEGLELLGWRAVPTEPIASGVGRMAWTSCPPSSSCSSPPRPAQDGVRPFGLALDRLVFPARKRIEHESAAAGVDVYFPSLSSRTIVYKGMLTTEQLPAFFPDITDARVESAIVVVHSRFSTNTFPAWPLAHPFRFIAHNGEINTVRGNRNWMRAREALLATDLIPGDLSRVYPICTKGASDSASFDEVLELLHLGGRTLPHAVLMMVPEAWENNELLDRDIRGFAEFHSSLMEPWDGPACVTFTDGRLLGAVLDRNGLRPGRWWRTDDGVVVLASESGVLPIPPERVVERGRLQPGRMFLVDTVAGRVLDDAEVKGALAAEHPYADWVHAGVIRLDDLPDREHIAPGARRGAATPAGVRLHRGGAAASSSRRWPAPGPRRSARWAPTRRRRCCPRRPRLLFDYFSQLFAQVTNPPLDAIREQVVTSLAGVIGPERNLLEPSPRSCRQVVLPYPAIDNDDLAKLVGINADGNLPGFASAVISGLFEVDRGGAGLADAVERCRRDADGAIAAGARILILSDRDSDATRAPIPSLLLTSAVHHHLVRGKTRTQVGLVVESGDAREVHHVALLLGYGAAVVNPYLLLETVEDLAAQGLLGDTAAGQGRPQHGVRARQGRAQGDEQDGHLHRRLLHRRPGVRLARPRPARGRRVLRGHQLTRRRLRPRRDRRRRRRPACAGLQLPTRPPASTGVWRSAATTSGAARASCTCSTRRRSTCCSTPPGPSRSRSSAATPTRSTRCRKQGGTLRGLFELRTDESRAVPLEEVEPAAEIVKRFVTGAMSYGSISKRGAHHAGHRDEPARRPSPTPARAARTSTGCSTRSGARRSSRSPPAGSGSPAPTW